MSSPTWGVVGRDELSPWEAALLRWGTDEAVRRMKERGAVAGSPRYGSEAPRRAVRRLLRARGRWNAAAPPGVS